MLLPGGYLLIRPTRATTGRPTSPNEGESQAESTDSFPATSGDASPRPPSWMIGPACALRVLAQNGKHYAVLQGQLLRDRMRESIQYRYLKDLFLSGALVDNKDTPVWRIRTPRQANVINMFYKMIMAVDDGPFEQGLMLLDSDAKPPHVRHWNGLVTLLRNRSVGVITVLSALLGVPTLAILAAVVYTPVYASARLYSYLRRVVSRYQYRRALRGRTSDGAEQRDKTDPATHQGEDAKCQHDGEDASGGHGDQSSRVDETSPTQGGGVGEQPILEWSGQ
ncbi:hypothetical protein EV363DRAFT_1160701 [Boletus edulis]|nr:hypothetical protein EV363DRAFT_1160701 [Boletus edulis]